MYLLFINEMQVYFSKQKYFSYNYYSSIQFTSPLNKKKIVHWDFWLYLFISQESTSTICAITLQRVPNKKKRKKQHYSITKTDQPKNILYYTKKHIKTDNTKKHIRMQSNLLSFLVQSRIYTPIMDSIHIVLPCSSSIFKILISPILSILLIYNFLS